jgi:mono/diheme cytochrome c family protein
MNGRRWLALAALAGLVACQPGAYPVDIFIEMHYQPSQRRLEPDRLAPPREAVPVTGREPAIGFAQAGGLANPVSPTAEARERARILYQQNCAACHGRDGHGQSLVAQHFQRNGRLPPVDLASPRVRGRTDGELDWIMTNGLGGMPPFGNLLTDQERWTLVYFVREVQGR